MTRSFGVFGQEFQEELCFLLLEDRQFADRLFEVLETKFFEYSYLKEFIKIIQDYKKNYKKHPSKKIVKTIIQQKTAEAERLGTKSLALGELVKYFTRVKDRLIEDEDYIKEQSIDFCRKRQLSHSTIPERTLIC